ncbi:MAG: exodeoxyribonuclease VII large subunit [Syntrophales bacterium]|nr:exodeoxyribonuclease VII large subunit [Syntrophales bacterium]
MIRPFIMEIWTVTELNERIKNLLEDCFDLLWVEGEISNVRLPSSGHLYFTLKDEQSQIRAVCFQYRTLKSLLFRGVGDLELKEGMHVLCRCRLSVYAPRGEYQLIVDRIELRGIGALQKAFEQLKEKLRKEGLFDPVHKKKIPFLPEAVGIITSPTGAVIRDILNIAARRFPSIPILIAPVRVQGEESPLEIVKALRDFNRTKLVDVIIMARGGGSLEDLYPFNTEMVARAIFDSSIPVVSAIGHETDFTIADFVADLRVPTPSAAAELVFPDRAALLENTASLYWRLLQSQRRFMQATEKRVKDVQRRLTVAERILIPFRLDLEAKRERLLGTMLNRMSEYRKLIHSAESILAKNNPIYYVQKKALKAAALKSALEMQIQRFVEEKKSIFCTTMAKLNALSPLGVLDRGYAVVFKLPEGMIVKDAALLQAGDEITVSVARGKFDAGVTCVYPDQ